MIHRREFLYGAVSSLVSGWLLEQSSAFAASTPQTDSVRRPAARFPHFRSEPVSYLQVKMQDTFWAPRQKTTREVSVQWITHAHDKAGGLEEYSKHPKTYTAADTVVNMEAIKFVEAMATVVGVQRDPNIEGLIDTWVKRVMQAQAADGYLEEHFPPGLDHPAQRWQAVWWSHEAYTTGSYVESAIAYREVTGSETMYASAQRATDNMATALLGGDHPYASGHPEMEQALMRLYEVTGDTRYLRLCGWLLDQRGHHEGRPSFGRMRQDDIPVKDQRQIEGHAVMAAYLFNGVTQYVGATGDAAYRDAVLSVWDDLVDHRLYLHGAGGNRSAKNEGYRKEPDCINPDDTYGESCSVFANFQWAHNLFRLTGEARHINVAERMLYNAFYASLSLAGNSSFYENVAQTDVPRPRDPELATSCCPPNIVKLFNKVGGFFYSTDSDGLYVKHYGASEASIAWKGGVKVIQRTQYPWDGNVSLLIEPRQPQSFTLRLRLPDWAKSHTLSINDQIHEIAPQKGWLSVHRQWKAGDRVELGLPMEVERVTMPARFKEYENRAALKRGPIVYCLEEQDLEVDTAHATNPITSYYGLATLYIPEDGRFTAEHRPDFLGGVTVLRGEVRQLNWGDDTEKSLSALFVPYGVWNNREPRAMRIWLGARKAGLVEMLLPEQKLGESCVG